MGFGKVENSMTVTTQGTRCESRVASEVETQVRQGTRAKPWEGGTYRGSTFTLVDVHRARF